ncbi:major facilitator superfamily domain-containing protein [Truncatella angustata]|uniref:Major facilitator superfamily domain-containing protein n=1 Tax=Truncatella angustata TaxID=152316 RepID=A0A9P8UY85_9PEZI|nr:major facilitator superfamily domain-containing protein [Truncatella angustata]KAH6660412.1 major facilitator superfamily domain-containing protein [Truncatella angustata]
MPHAQSNSVCFETVQIEDAKDEPFQPSVRLKLAFMALMVLTFMVAVNCAALAVALPIVAVELNGTAFEAFWAGTSFLLTEAIFMAPLGRLSDTMGRVPVLNLSTALFLVGTIVSSVSNNFATLIIGRAVTGAGGGGVVVSLEIVVTDLVPLSIRGNYFSVISVLWVLGDVIGPILGGVLASRASWRWIFWINIPIAIAGLISTNLFIRLQNIPGTFYDKAKRVDWCGMAISITAVTSLLVGVTWGGVVHAWDSFATILPIVMGFLGIFMFAAFEKYMASVPMIRFDLLGSYNILYALFAAFFHSIMAFGLIYVLPLYFEAVQRFSPIHAALAVIPYGITLAPFSAVAGVIISKTGHINWVIRIGYAITISGAGLLVLLGSATKIWKWVLILAWIGVGLGLLYNALVLLAQAALEEQHAAFAVTILNFFRHLGQAVGVAIVGVVFQNRMKGTLLENSQTAPFADTFSKDTAALIQELSGMEDGEFKDGIVGAYAAALKTIWMVMCAFCVLPFLGSFFLQMADLNRRHETSQGLRDNKEKSERQTGR